MATETLQADSARANPATITREEFQASIEHLNEAEAAEMTDENADLAADLALKLIQSPAPDAAALRWKLDYFLAPENKASLYTDDVLAQTVADYRRLLASGGPSIPEAPPAEPASAMRTD